MNSAVSWPLFNSAIFKIKDLISMHHCFIGGWAAQVVASMWNLCMILVGYKYMEEILAFSKYITKYRSYPTKYYWWFQHSSYQSQKNFIIFKTSCNFQKHLKLQKNLNAVLVLSIYQKEPRLFLRQQSTEPWILHWF